MNIYYISGLLFLVTTKWFLAGFNRERRRQRAFTWPKTRVALPDEKLSLQTKESAHDFVATLTKSYHFFYRGEKTANTSVILHDPKISVEQQKLILAILEERRNKLNVRFNPDNPKESTLQIGLQELSWTRTLFYIFIGIVIPAFLLFSHQSWLSAPGNWQDAIQFIPKAG